MNNCMAIVPRYTWPSNPERPSPSCFQNPAKTTFYVHVVPCIALDIALTLNSLVKHPIEVTCYHRPPNHYKSSYLQLKLQKKYTKTC